MARLNIARSRLRCSIWSRTRMVQTSFGFNGRFWPIRRPLFQGSRRRGKERVSSVFMVVSFEADPFHLSAEPPSTGWVAYPQKTLLRRKPPCRPRVSNWQDWIKAVVRALISASAAAEMPPASGFLATSAREFMLVVVSSITLLYCPRQARPQPRSLKRTCPALTHPSQPRIGAKSVRVSILRCSCWRADVSPTVRG
jgi:hypothetical protein